MLSHLRKWRLPAALFALLLWVGPVTAEPWKKLPWHLADYYFHMPAIADFRTLSMDVEIQGDLRPGQYVYISPLNGKIGGAMFYFGMQTDLSRAKPQSQVGKGFIFSRWGGTRPEDGIPAAGGWIDSLTHQQSGEGDFVSARLAYDWQPGRYTFRLEARPQGDGQWLDLSVTDHQRLRRLEIGSLRVPVAPPASFDPRPAAFVEIYGRPPRHPDNPAWLKAPDFSVRFSAPRVNGALMPEGGSVHQSTRVPPFARVVRGADFGAAITIGGMAEAR